MRVVMGPVNETTKVVPLVHAAHFDAIAHSHRHPLSDIDVMNNEQRLLPATIDDKALVTRSIMIVMKQTDHVTLAGNPIAVIARRQNF